MPVTSLAASAVFQIRVVATLCAWFLLLRWGFRGANEPKGLSLHEMPPVLGVTVPERMVGAVKAAMSQHLVFTTGELFSVLRGFALGESLVPPPAPAGPLVVAMKCAVSIDESLCSTFRCGCAWFIEHWHATLLERSSLCVWTQQLEKSFERLLRRQKRDCRRLHCSTHKRINCKAMGPGIA